MFLGKVPVSQARNPHFHPCLWFALAAAVCRPALFKFARQQQPCQIADPEEFTLGTLDSAVVSLQGQSRQRRGNLATFLT